MPITSQQKIVETFALLNLSSEEQALIMGGNTERLLQRG
jgi:hypothetical protein